MDNNMTMTLLPEHSGSDYTDNTSDIEDSPTQLGIKVFSGVSMSLVILITILGNLLVISAVFKFRSLRTMNNCFIVSLAVADLLVGKSHTYLSSTYLVYYLLGLVSPYL